MKAYTDSETPLKACARDRGRLAERRSRRVLVRGILTLMLAMLVRNLSASAQGVTVINFGALPTGEALGEQFASEGIHFFGLPRQSTGPVTVATPPPLNDVGSPVGRAIAFGLRSDSPIISLTFKVAEVGAGSVPGYIIQPLDSSGNSVGPAQGGEFPAGAWAPASAAFTAAQGVHSVAIEGWTGGTERFPATLYFNNIAVTTVPEPATLWVLALGGVGLGLSRRFRLKNPRCAVEKGKPRGCLRRGRPKRRLWPRSPAGNER